MSATDEAVEVCRAWAAAELAGDAGALEGLATSQLVLVGPVGFVLDRAAWLGRFEPDGLAIEALDWHETQVVEHDGHAVVVVGEVQQRATHAGRRADGAFRTVHTLVPDGGAWRLALLQYSMLGGPPPFAQQG